MESRFTRRRNLARDRHFCTVCFWRPASQHRTVCSPCNEAAKIRVKRQRLRKAENEALHKTLLSHESAGDFARAAYAYPEALNQYGEALRSPVVRPDDEWRLCEKYANTLFCSHEPEKAGPWFERALLSCRSSSATPNASNIVSILLRLARQCWLNAETTLTLPWISEALQTAAVAKNDALVGFANLNMAHYLTSLGRVKAAEPFFWRAEELCDGVDTPEWRAVNCRQRAIVFAARGERAAAYRDFETAVEAAKELPDGYGLTSAWDDYSIWAMALGDIRTAQLCRERALLVARERHVAWRIPYLSLRYADLLLELEQYERARELVLDSLTYDCKTPCIKILTVTIGTRLAEALDDDGLRRRCNDGYAIDYAFRSGEPARIGPLASALIRSCRAQGDRVKSANIIRKAFAAVSSADHARDLLVDVALHGSEAERRRARVLLHSRTALPSAAIAKAYLDMFDAVSAKRFGNLAQSRQLAQRAARHFKRAGWLAQERYALSFVEDTASRRDSQRRLRAFRTMLGSPSTLTRREAEVAELALKGFTNRAIARELSVSEYTVESHMTSILNRLGIRSRHQLANMIVDSGKALS